MPYASIHNPAIKSHRIDNLKIHRYNQIHLPQHISNTKNVGNTPAYYKHILQTSERLITMNGALFWNASTEDLKRGFLFNEHEKTYICLLCGEAFEQGIVYPMGDVFYDAEKAVDTHVKTQHQHLFEFFLGLGRVYTGLSQGQADLAKLFYEGHSDKEIVAMTGANSASTIRNQRFSIREKYKQAKVLVALTELMEDRLEQIKQSRKADAADGGDKLVDFHPTANSIDERFAITESDKNEILKRYFGADNQLLIKSFPAKEKNKLIILQKIIQDFEVNKQFSEKEVNDMLKRYYSDFVSIRRYLVEYGFLDRSSNGMYYWVR